MSSNSGVEPEIFQNGGWPGEGGGGEETKGLRVKILQNNIKLKLLYLLYNCFSFFFLLPYLLLLLCFIHFFRFCKIQKAVVVCCSRHHPWATPSPTPDEMAFGQ